MAIPNVSVIRARATGLRHAAGTVRAVVYRTRTDHRWDTERDLDVDIAVDAMGMGSRLRAWLAEYGFGAAAVKRAPVGVSYATALSRRPGGSAVPDIPYALHQFGSPAPAGRAHVGGGNAAIAVYAIEKRLWQVVAMSYKHNHADTTADNLRTLCADLPEVFREATACIISRKRHLWHQPTAEPGLHSCPIGSPEFGMKRIPAGNHSMGEAGETPESGSSVAPGVGAASCAPDIATAHAICALRRIMRQKNSDSS